MNEGSGQLTADSSGNLNTGTLGSVQLPDSHDPVWLFSGEAWDGASALDFDGGDDYVHVNDSNSLDLTSSMTLQAWIYARSVGLSGASRPYQYLFLKGTTDLSAVNYFLRLYTYFQSPAYYTNLEFGFRVGGTIYIYARPFPTFPPPQWVHVAATLTTGNTARVYVGTAYTEYATTQTPVANASPLYLGGGGATNGFDGRMDVANIESFYGPTAVEVAGLKAARSGNLMRIVWEALGLPDVLGYNVLRRDPSASAWTRANSAMILPEGGAMYHARLAFADQRARAGAEYRLEAVRADGSSGVYEVPQTKR